jgi:hypothetical protein
MGGARALFASLGASLSFVAGAALSLLAVTFVVAYHVSHVGIQKAPAQSVFVSEWTPPAPGERSRSPATLIVPASRPSAPKAAARASRRRVDPHAVLAAAVGSRMRPPPAAPDVGDMGPVAPPPAPTSAELKPAAGDGVREVGAALSATVQGTAGATDAVYAPLGPPVAEAVQKVLDLVTALLQGTTTAIGGALDAARP